MQKQIEQEEEFITNKLIKRLGDLKLEKQKLASAVEEEEEFLTNNLQKRLNQLMKEKADLTERLESEQEYIVNKLQKRIDRTTAEKDKLRKEKHELKREVGELRGAVSKLSTDKIVLENNMEAEEENIVNRLHKVIEELMFRNRALERRLDTSRSRSESEASASEGVSEDEEGMGRRRRGMSAAGYPLAHSPIGGYGFPPSSPMSKPLIIPTSGRPRSASDKAAGGSPEHRGGPRRGAPP